MLNVLRKRLKFLRKRSYSSLFFLVYRRRLTFTEAEIKGFISQMAQARHENEEKLQEFYAKNPRNRIELEFNLRQERVMNFLLDKAKVQ